MEIRLTKKPKNPIIIEGFPGFGLVGTISSEFLIEHLKCEVIGSLFLDEIPAMIAIHDSKVIQPMGIYYNKEYNIVFIHGITVVQGVEWKIVDAILELATQLGVKEIISLEGVGSMTAQENPQVFYYTNKSDNAKKLEKAGLKQMKEGIIMGVSGAMLYKGQSFANTCLFSETASNMPDSTAAAKIIEALDKYLGLDVDYKPLLKQAEKFEEKVKDILIKGKQAMSDQQKKQLSYVG
jgi:uncharacterized protein